MNRVLRFLIYDAADIFVYLFPFFGIFIFDRFFYLVGIAVLLFLPLYGFAFSAVYHRLFAHRAFIPKDWVPLVGTAVAILIFMFPHPKAFATTHRAHHRLLDTDKDPATPKFGARFVFLPTFFKKSKLATWIDPKIENIASKDLIRLYPFIDKINPLNARISYITFTCAMYLISNELFFVVILLSFFSRIVTAHINAFTHTFRDDGSPHVINMPLKALLITSEYNHKIHHEHPSSYDFSAGGVKDWTKVAIDKFLSKK